MGGGMGMRIHQAGKGCYACYAVVTVGVTPETDCATADLPYLVTLLHL